MIIAETPRLLLRHFHIGDLDAMAALFADPEVMRFGRGPQSREWTERWLRGCLEDYFAKWGFGLWAVFTKQQCQVAGFCGLTLFDDVDGRREIEIGYRLVRAFWKQGIATEAARAVRDYAFGVLGLERLISIINPENTASIRVAEKNGLRHEKDALLWGLVQRIYAVHRSDIGFAGNNRSG